MIDYDLAITMLAAGAALPLLGTIAMMVTRRNKEAADYGVIVFTASMAAFFTLIWLRRAIEWPSWLIIVYFTIALTSSWGLFFWVLRSILRK